MLPGNTEETMRQKKRKIGRERVSEGKSKLERRRGRKGGKHHKIGRNE